MVSFEALINWTILITLISSITSYLFMRYGTLKNIVLNLTDFTEDDIQSIRSWIKWKS